MNKRSGAVIAGAMAAMLASGITLAADKAEKSETKNVKCDGSNSCKGKSDCATAHNSCKGQNSCKGKGMTFEASEKACNKAGGKAEKETKG